jgi:hypothetical protein
MRNIVGVSLIGLLAFCATEVHAQETTASVRGTVTANGEAVPGATVTVTHVPSGTISTTATDRDGAFSSSGLRPGGPFTITVVASGFGDYLVTDLSLTAGQPLRIPIALESGASDIVVTASRSRAVETSAGPITTISRDEIAGVATVNRDIRDIVRRDAFATIDPGQGRGVMIAGQNARLNKFSVDGLAFSDDFGLNSGGLPTARGPVPIDAIEQMSVKVAPYDITEGNFQGGSINVILRSGTNRITGSAFYTYNSDALTGDRTKAGIVSPTGRINLDFKSRNYGGFLSGPIIKDKLFIAASYEKLREGTPIQIGTPGFPSVVPGLTNTQIDGVTSIARSIYNYDTLGVQSSTLEEDEKYTVKLDWNIAEGQRLSATYIHNGSSNGSTAGVSSTIGASPALGLQSNNYLRPEKIDSYVVQLSSDWSDRIHTEIRGNYRRYAVDPRPLGAAGFSQMQVCLDPTSALQLNGAVNADATLCSQGSTAAPGAARLYLGTPAAFQFNFVHTRQIGGEALLRADLGTVTLKGTAAFNKLDVENAFTQNALGSYYFDSLADFQARRASSVTYAGSVTGDLNDTLASFQYWQTTFGGQLAWDPIPDFNLTVGSRIDFYGGIDAPPLNNFFTTRYGFSNRSSINGKSVWQPRISASWSGVDRLTLKAGFGLFGGGSPNVFIGNSFSVSGVYANSVTIARAVNGAGCQGGISAALCSAALDNVNGTTPSAALIDYIRANTGALSTANVNAMAPGYRMQSTWKASFSADYKADFDNFLGHGWNFGADVYYGFVKDAPIYRDLRLTQVGTAPDGRPRYATTTPTSANTDFLLTNTHRGHSLIATARIDKAFDFGLSLGASYTFQDVTDVNPMNGSTASSNYGQSAVLDPNVSAYGTSIYQIRNSVKFHIDFDRTFFGDNHTRFSLFGERRSGIPYSLTMTDAGQTLGHGNVFGAAGLSSRYLFYVPTLNDPLVANTTAADAATLAALNSFIDQNGLGRYRGQVIGKNTQRSPQWTKIDLHIEQELPVPVVDSGKITLFADIENVLNLIDYNWGALRQVPLPYLASVVNVSCANLSGSNCTQYRYSNFSNPAVDNVGRISLYAVRLGVRVGF